MKRKRLSAKAKANISRGLVDYFKSNPKHPAKSEVKGGKAKLVKKGAAGVLVAGGAVAAGAAFANRKEISEKFYGTTRKVARRVTGDALKSEPKNRFEEEIGKGMLQGAVDAGKYKASEELKATFGVVKTKLAEAKDYSAQRAVQDTAKTQKTLGSIGKAVKERAQQDIKVTQKAFQTRAAKDRQRRDTFLSSLRKTKTQFSRNRHEAIIRFNQSN